MIQKFKDKNIGVLMGGCSVEKEISLKTGEAVSSALERLGYGVKKIRVDTDIPFALKSEKIDIAFIALHGRYGEDGTIQGLLEMMQIPYTGSGVSASALSMNKLLSRDIFKAHQLPMPPAFILNSENRNACSLPKLPFETPPGTPVVVKPVSEGSSVGVAIVEEEKAFHAALDVAAQYGLRIIIEHYITGKEVHVGILNEVALGAIEIKPKGRFYDYSAKYESGMSEHIFPAPLSKDCEKEVLKLALKAHQVLGCCGYSRVDLLIDGNDQPHLLEVNALPGMTETSLMPEIARGVGISFDRLVEQILETASLGK